MATLRPDTVPVCLQLNGTAWANGIRGMADEVITPALLRRARRTRNTLRQTVATGCHRLDSGSVRP